jgi:hypothetical protein
MLFDYLQFRGSLEEQSKEFLYKARQKNIQWAQANVMIFLDFHKERVRRIELVDKFQNNNEEYNKIRNAAEEKVYSRGRRSQ